MTSGLLAMAKDYKAALCAVCLSAAVAVALVQSYRFAGAREALATADGEAAVLRVQLEAQQVGMAALQAAAKEQELLAKEALTKAASIQASANKRVAAIKATPTPATCEQAVRFLVEDARTPQ